MMRFDLSPEQQQLKETARRFAADEIIPVAACFDEEQTFPADVARKAWDLGLNELRDPGRGRRCGARREGVSGREAHAGRKLLQIYEGTSQVQRIVIARNLLKG